MITYEELLRKNQLELESILTNMAPIYQNPEIKRPSTDPYEIQIYQLPNGKYKKRILVHFSELPEGLRGVTDGDRFVGVDKYDYQPFFVLGHEATHLRHLDWSEYRVRAYSPRVSSLEDVQNIFSEFEFVIIR